MLLFLLAMSLLCCRCCNRMHSCVTADVVVGGCVGRGVGVAVDGVIVYVFTFPVVGGCRCVYVACVTVAVAVVVVPYVVFCWFCHCYCCSICS